MHKDLFVVGLCNLIWAMMERRRISLARTRPTRTRASIHNRCSGVENSHPDNVWHTKYLTFFFQPRHFTLAVAKMWMQSSPNKTLLASTPKMITFPVFTMVTPM